MSDEAEWSYNVWPQCETEKSESTDKIINTRFLKSLFPWMTDGTHMYKSPPSAFFQHRCQRKQQQEGKIYRRGYRWQHGGYILKYLAHMKYKHPFCCHWGQESLFRYEKLPRLHYFDMWMWVCHVVSSPLRCEVEIGPRRLQKPLCPQSIRRSQQTPNAACVADAKLCNCYTHSRVVPSFPTWLVKAVSWILFHH